MESERENTSYVLERTIGGHKLRVELTPGLEWSGDEPLLSACLESQNTLQLSFSPALGEPAAFLSSRVADALGCAIVERPAAPAADAVVY